MENPQENIDTSGLLPEIKVEKPKKDIGASLFKGLMAKMKKDDATKKDAEELEEKIKEQRQAEKNEEEKKELERVEKMTEEEKMKENLEKAE